MKKLVIIGANDFQNRLILKAKALGYETHAFAWRDGAIGEKTADFFYDISITERDKILDKCREIKPDGICSIASDLATLTVNYVAGALGLPCNSAECTDISTNKFRMREAFKAAGVPVPGYITVGADFRESDADGLSLPCVVKPTDRSGSRAITKITKRSQLMGAVTEATAVSFEKRAIIEEYIEGNEYSCECISQGGIHNFLAFTKKFTTGAPHFIETGHIEPSDIPEELHEKIKRQIFAALTALKIADSASHSEFKLDRDGNAHIIEIGARMGGDCIGSDLVPLSTGIDFMKLVIDTACGNKIALSPSEAPLNAGIRFIFGEEDIRRFREVERKMPEVIYRVSEFELKNEEKTVDSSTRVGYYIVTAKSKSELYDIMGEING